MCIGIVEDALHQDLMDANLYLGCYPDGRKTLVRLKHAGLQTAILSNGTPAMLQSAVDSAKIEALIDHIWSVAVTARSLIRQFVQIPNREFRATCL